MDFRQAFISGLSGILFGVLGLLALPKSVEASDSYPIRFVSPTFARQQAFYHPYSRSVPREKLRKHSNRMGQLWYASSVLRNKRIPAMPIRRFVRKAQPVVSVKDVSQQFKPHHRFTGEGYGKIVELTTKSDPSVNLDVHAQFRPLEKRKKTYEELYGAKQDIPRVYTPALSVTPYPVVPYYPYPPMPMPYGRRW